MDLITSMGIRMNGLLSGDDQTAPPHTRQVFSTGNFLRGFGNVRQKHQAKPTDLHRSIGLERQRGDVSRTKTDVLQAKRLAFRVATASMDSAVDADDQSPSVPTTPRRRAAPGTPFPIRSSTRRPGRIRASATRRWLMNAMVRLKN